MRLLLLVCTAPLGCRSNLAMDILQVAQTHKTFYSMLENGHAPPRRARPHPLPGGFLAHAWAISRPFGWKWVRLPLSAAVASTYYSTGDSRANFLIFVVYLVWFPNFFAPADCPPWRVFNESTTSRVAANRPTHRYCLCEAGRCANVPAFGGHTSQSKWCQMVASSRHFCLQSSIGPRFSAFAACVVFPLLRLCTYSDARRSCPWTTHSLNMLYLLGPVPSPGVILVSVKTMQKVGLLMTGVRVSETTTVSEEPSSPSLLLLQLVGKHVVGDEAKGAARAVFLPLARFNRCGADHFAVFGPWTLQGAVVRPFRLTVQVRSNGGLRCSLNMGSCRRRFDALVSMVPYPALRCELPVFFCSLQASWPTQAFGNGGLLYFLNGVVPAEPLRIGPAKVATRYVLLVVFSDLRESREGAVFFLRPHADGTLDCTDVKHRCL